MFKKFVAAWTIFGVDFQHRNNHLLQLWRPFLPVEFPERDGALTVLEANFDSPYTLESESAYNRNSSCTESLQATKCPP